MEGTRSVNQKKRLKEALTSGTVMVLLGLAAGMVFNLARPGGIPFMGDWSPKAVTERHAGSLEVIGVDEAFELFTRGQALFIDARNPADYAGGHIPGTVNIPPGEAQGRINEVRSLLETGKTLVAYCHDADCPSSAELVKRLQQQGAGPIKVMPEGWAGWVDRGYPYE